MKFKTKEELLSDVNYQGITSEYRNGQRSGINITFKSFAERVEFYKKYENNESKLEDEEKYIADLWFKYMAKKLRIENGRQIEYNKWLFNYCFGDVK